MEGLVIGVVLIAILLFIASMRLGKSEFTTKPSDLKSFVSEVDDQVALKAIVNFA